MADAGVAHYYDRLQRWNVVADLFGYGGGHRALTVHRRLADPRAGGRPTTTRIHDLLLEHLPAAAVDHARHRRAPGEAVAGETHPAHSSDRPFRMLDAGCGLGGTLLAFASQFRGRFVGITLSSDQAAVARRAASARGFADSIEVLVQSYDTPPAGPFDVIVAVESLAHSRGPARSVAALSAVLAPGGRLIVVDDMPEPGAERSPDFPMFTAGWRSEHLWSRASYLDAFDRLGLVRTVDANLTNETRPRSLARIARLERLNRIATSVVPSTAFRQVMHSHLGGLALERLTRNGLMSYRMLGADRPLTS